MITPAITRFGLSNPVRPRMRNPLCSVYMSVSVVIRFGQRYSFHELRNASEANADGRAHERHGHVAEDPDCPTPSMAAASRRSRGRDKKTWRMRNVPNAVARNSTVEALVAVEPAEVVDRLAVDHEVAPAAPAAWRGRRRTDAAPRPFKDGEGVRRQYGGHDLCHGHDRDHDRVDHVAVVTLRPCLPEYLQRQ